MQTNGESKTFPDVCIFLWEGRGTVPEKIVRRTAQTEIVTGEVRTLKEKRCQLLEIIHARQQELDQLDYQIYKLVRQQATGEVE